MVGNGTGGRRLYQHLLARSAIKQCVHAPASLPDANMLVGTTKIECRRAGKFARQNLTQVERSTASGKICVAAINSTFFKRANRIACYLASDDEVNCQRLIECAWHMKKRVFLPVLQKTSELKFVEYFKESETRTNRYGLSEPVGGDAVNPRELDIVFAPVVAFDSKCNRIGMGGGYYDRTFAFLNEPQHESGPRLLGLAFNCQRVEQIDASTWDIRLFHVITEAEQNE